MSQKINIEKWGSVDGKEVMLYTLSNKNGMKVQITNYGGTIVSINIPDKNNVFENVVLTFDSLDGFLQKENPSFGCLIGRYANRIANASFTLYDVEYTLAANNNSNTLHGGLKGFDKVVWTSTPLQQSNSIQLSYYSPDNEEGFPGNLNVEVLYQLTDDNSVSIHYTATTDAATPVNFTNHAYFNLSAGADADILNHELMLTATRYTEADDMLIPTGRLLDVKDTPLDFTVSKKVGRDIADIQPGYDHNFVLDNESGTLKNIGLLYHAKSGRIMRIATTQPGVQLYTGNFLDGSLKHTPGGIRYYKHAGLCLETQHYPDSPNQPSFPGTILMPGEKFDHTTEYSFSVK
ncbi:MAG: galactose mutarotase [Chitinophagaceae bacterium]|nr:galactose mutarotase [Chitinophagaceae bacterium]